MEALPHGLLMWRSLTHWLGGLGIIVLSLIVLPLLGVGGMQLYRAEVTGPTPDKLTPRMQDTAIALWKLYGLMTLVLTVLLYLAGMDWFDALNHSFSTVATGGFSTKNASIAAYPQASIQWILIVFMFIAGISFSLHSRALRGMVTVYFRDRECRFYTGLLLLGSAIMVFNLVENRLFQADTLAEVEYVVRAAVFQLVSICTTTGFVTENYNLWPALTLVIILMFTLMGASAGSTGGGLKVMRLVMLFRLAYMEIFRLLHPHSVRHLKVAGKSVPTEVISGVVGFFLLYLMITTVGTLILAAQNLDLVTAFTATLHLHLQRRPRPRLRGAGGQFQPPAGLLQMDAHLVHVAGKTGNLRHHRVVCSRILARLMTAGGRASASSAYRESSLFFMRESTGI